MSFIIIGNGDKDIQELIHFNNTKQRWPFCIAALFSGIVFNIKQFYHFQNQLELWLKSLHLKHLMQT